MAIFNLVYVIHVFTLVYSISVMEGCGERLKTEEGRDEEACSKAADARPIQVPD
jgi:hypothetical protein